jgi:hypothetical protein
VKRETKQRKLAELLGIEFPEPPTKQELEDKATASREAEAVLLYGASPKAFIQRECKNCGFVFAVDRSSIAYCSDDCRAHAILRDWKIVWNPKARTLADRWGSQTGGPEPLVIPPLVLTMLQQEQERRQQEQAEKELALQEIKQQSVLGLDDLLALDLSDDL